jgi:hypothetical protein
MWLPSASDINPIPEDLDGRVAEEHFLGKSLDEAIVLFKENGLLYQEDLMWMGPKAYCFYVHAAIAYIKSEDAGGDSDFINSLGGNFEFRLKRDRNEIEAVLGAIKEACEYVLENWSKYDVKSEVYGDLHGKYRELLHNLSPRRGLA